MKFFYITLLITGFFARPVFAQKVADQGHSADFKEQLQIFTDRGLYIAGEDVFYKVYKQNAVSGRPDSLSKVVYIEVLNKENQAVAQQKIRTSGWFADNLIRLPDTLGTGNYVLRAYTKWMQNFSPELFAYRTFSVINPFKPVAHNPFPVKSLGADSVAFYPEGGFLVQNIPCRLGLKVSDKQGLPLKDLKMWLLSEKDTLGFCKSDANGNGIISFTPHLKSEIYLQTAAGKAKKFKLPGIRKEGALLSVKVDEETEISFRKTGNSTEKADLYILAKGAPVFRQEIRDFGQKIKLKKSDLPAGRLQIQLIDKNETLSFCEINTLTKTDYRPIISGLKQTYGKRSKVSFSLEAGAKNLAEYSVSVIKKCFADSVRESETGPYVARPLPVKDFIFDENSRFLFPEIGGHILSGKVTDSLSNPLKDSTIIFSIVGKTAKNQFQKSDSAGQFSFVVDEFGPKDVVVQAMKQFPGNCFVELDYPYSVKFKAFDAPLFFPDTSILAEINRGIINSQIQNKFYESTGKDTVFYKEERHFYGRALNTFELSNYIELNSFPEMVKEIIPLVYNKNEKNNYSIEMADELSGKIFTNGPLVLMDGVPIADTNELKKLQSKNLSIIELIRLNYIIGKLSLGGILHITTQKGDLGTYKLPEHFFRQIYRGYDNQKARFPVYATSSEINSRLPDRRNTLFRQAGRSAKAGEKQLCEFYTADELSSYLVVIEGLTNEGETFYQSRIFTVN